MKRRISAFAAVAILACFPLASPLQACCDDLWSCMGAVASAGLSCVVENLVNSIKTLIDNVGRLMATLAHQVSDVVNLAITELGNAANDLRVLASKAESDFAAATQLATTVVNDANRMAEALKKASLGTTITAIAGKSGASVAMAGGGTKPPAAGSGKSHSGTGGLPAGTGPTGSGNVPGNVINYDPPADSAQILDALRQGKETIDSMRPDITAPVNQVRQSASQAEQQAASAASSAAGIAENALLGPLQVLGNLLTGLVAHPERIFDPSRMVDDAINQVTSQVISTMNQVHDAVMFQARATLNQAQPPLQHALDRSATAKQIADAMQRLARARTQSTFNGLKAVLPRQRVDVNTLVSQVAQAAHSSGMAALDLNSHRSMIAAPFARLDAVKLTSRTVGTQINAKLKNPWQEFKRLKAAPVTLDPSAKPKLDAEIQRRFSGKTAAESEAEKRLLMAEARSRFATDPDLLRKVELLIEAHPVINGHIGGPRKIQ